MKNAIALVLAAGCLAGVAQAATITLADRNSLATVDDSGVLGGMNSWQIDGVSNLSLQGFWYRIAGMDSEANIATLPLTGTVVTDTNGFVDPRADTLTMQYSGRGFTIEPSWHLRGGSAGSNRSDIAETIGIHNFGNTPLVISFFQYSDFDLGGTTQDQSVSIGGVGSNTVNQSDIGFLANETVVTPAPTRFEAAFFGSLITRLNDASIDNLNNVGGPLGPGDLTWAYQWDFTIPAGGSVIISKDKQIVPTPGVLALLGVGTVVTARRRR